MAEYTKFLDWLVSTIPIWWNFWMGQHFIFKAIMLTPFVLMVVTLIYKTFHVNSN